MTNDLITILYVNTLDVVNGLFFPFKQDTEETLANSFIKKSRFKWKNDEKKPTKIVYNIFSHFHV